MAALRILHILVLLSNAIQSQIAPKKTKHFENTQLSPVFSSMKTKEKRLSIPFRLQIQVVQRNGTGVSDTLHAVGLNVFQKFPAGPTLSHYILGLHELNHSSSHQPFPEPFPNNLRY